MTEPASPRSIPEEYAAKMKSARATDSMRGERRLVSILFCDVTGSSAMAKDLDPEDWAEVMQEAFEYLIAPVYRYEGTLARMMGDGIMAFFGDAEPEGGAEDKEEERVERQAANAVRAGLSMQMKMTELNARWQSQGRESHLIRIGINTGVVTVGKMGTEHLWDYTVLGTEVNKAQRLESTSEPGGLLLARRTYALARKQGLLSDDLLAKTATLKGLGEHTDLYPVAPELIDRFSVGATPSAVKSRRQQLKEKATRLFHRSSGS